MQVLISAIDGIFEQQTDELAYRQNTRQTGRQRPTDRQTRERDSQVEIDMQTETHTHIPKQTAGRTYRQTH